MNLDVPTAPFVYEPLFDTGTDDTQYRLLTKDHVKVRQFEGQDVLCIDPQALTLLCSQAFHDINFFLRPAHLKQVAAILDVSVPRVYELAARLAQQPAVRCRLPAHGLRRFTRLLRNRP